MIILTLFLVLGLVLLIACFIINNYGCNFVWENTLGVVKHRLLLWLILLILLLRVLHIAIVQWLRICLLGNLRILICKASHVSKLHKLVLLDYVFRRWVVDFEMLGCFFNSHPLTFYNSDQIVSFLLLNFNVATFSFENLF
jgi:hypothetical protein